MLDRLKPSREFLTDVLHLLVLCSFAASQPLFDLLGRNPEFFVARRSRPVDILFLTLSLSLFVPVFLAFLEWLASLVGRRVQQTIHVLMVTTLAVLVAMPPLKKVGDSHPGILIAGAILLGLFVAVGCVRLPFVRSFLTILSPAIALFPLFFLLYTPVRKIVFPQPDATGRRLEVKATAPVVVVVFDEFTSVSLMDERHDIDPLRYSNFAAFAKESTWFRNATTVTPASEGALTAILTGLRPDPRLLPTAQDYPRNLFTLLHGSYGMSVVEPLTHVCADTVCRQTAPLPPATVRLRSMFLDLSAIYLHVVLPTALTRRLPVVTQSWGDFWQAGKGEGQGTAKERDAALRGWHNPKEQFDGFLKSIGGTEGPMLYFLHVALPHVPWQFLPSGKRYTDPRLDVPGLDFGKEQWGADNWLVIQGYQRYLLQVGFVDKLLGELVARLKALGLYKDSLVVITADHGVSFRAGGKRRKVERENYQDIMPVPLFVKAPGQREGKIDDRNVESIDILPTIADILGIELPWPLDGTSAWNPSVPERGEKLICNPKSREEVFKLDAAFPAKYSTLQEKLALFGSGARPDGLFKIGSFRDLVGKRITEVDLAGETAVKVDLDQPSSLFKDFTPSSDFVPALISGELRKPGSASPPRVDLAIAINGTIQAVTRTFDKKSYSPTPALSRALGVAGFQAVVPETAFQAGDNEVQVFMVSRGADGRTRLAYTHTKSPATYSLLPPGNPQKIVSSRGVSYRIDPRAVAGSFLIRESGNTYLISGWGADLNHSEPAKAIIVFSSAKGVYAGPVALARPDVAQYFKKPPLRNSGFAIALPRYLFRGGGNSDISIFALSKRGMASQMINPDLPAGPAKSRLAQKPLTVKPTAGGSEEKSPLTGRRTTSLQIRYHDGVVGAVDRWGVTKGLDNRPRAYVDGWALSLKDQRIPEQIAVAVNEEIVAVTRPRHNRGEVARVYGNRKFVACGWDVSFALPAGDIRYVAAFVVLDGMQGRVAPLNTSPLVAQNLAQQRGASLLGQDVGSLDVGQYEAMGGNLDQLRIEEHAGKSYVTVSGWAVSWKRMAGPDWIAIAANGVIAALTGPCCARGDVVERYKSEGLLRSGWVAKFPLPPGGLKRIGVYVIVDADRRKLVPIYTSSQATALLSQDNPTRPGREK